MAECMWMPDTPEEFIEEFAFVDSKQVYTNGAELISVLRVKQMLEHYFRKVEPVVYAHWEFYEDESGEWWDKCSRCGGKLHNEGGYCCGLPRCPECGAHMDEEVAK